MSVASKRRFITNKAESEMYIPVEGDIIAQIRAARGNNLHEVEDENGEVYMVSMPPKFRKALWIRRGQFVVVRSIGEGDKVKGEIEHVLDAENVLYIREQKLWPEHFDADAHLLTRESRRGDKGEHGMIDADMLPPSDSDDCSDEENEDEEECDDEDVGGGSDYGSDCEPSEMDQFNPNRSKAPEHI